MSKILLLIAFVAFAANAQRSLSSPVTIGGVNCGEIRLKEAFATGGSYATWKACQDSFGEVTMSLISATGVTTFTGIENGNLLYGSQQFRAVGGTEAKVLINYPSGVPEVSLRDGSGANAILLKPTGIVFDQQSSAPATPSTGDVIVYAYSAKSGICSKDSAGTELCLGDVPPDIVTTNTTQSISGEKTFATPVHFAATGVDKFLFNTISGRGVQQVYNSSGIVGVSIDGNGDVFTNTTELTLAQYGDSLGSTTLNLQNRFGMNGGSIEVGSLDLADWRMCGSSGGCMTMRHELRFSGGFTFLDGSKKEFQFGDMGVTGGVGLLVNVDGAGTGKGDYFRFLGSTGGYVGLVAPSSVSSYTLTLPAATGSTNQRLCLTSSTVLGWCSPASASSTMETPVQFQTSGTNKAYFNTVSSRMIAQFYNSSGNTGIELDAGASGGQGQITLRDTSGVQRVKIDSEMEFSNASSVVHSELGSSTSFGGYLNLYTNSGNQAVLMDGTGNGRIRVSDGTSLRTGFTGTVNFSTCTAATVVMGLYITGC